MRKENLKKLSILISDIQTNIQNNPILEAKEYNGKFSGLNGVIYEFDKCLETKKIFIEDSNTNDEINIKLINIDDVAFENYKVDLNDKNLDLSIISEEILFVINDEAEGLDLYKFNFDR